MKFHSQKPNNRNCNRSRRLLRLICPAFPAFNIYSRPAEVMTALGPICIATAVHDIPGWDVEVIDENNYRNGPKTAEGFPDHHAIQEDRPADVVGFYGGLTSTVPRLYEIAKLYSNLGAKTIAGGHHFVPQNIPDALDHSIDVIVRGEGELTIRELLKAFDNDSELSEIDGLAFRENGEVVYTDPREPITDFDALPIPDFSVLRYGKVKYFPISGVRGCGMDCEFCSVKGKPRRSTPSRMMEQFASAHEKHDAKVFFIVDDLFGQHRKDTLELLRMLKEYQQSRNVKFTITVQIRLDRSEDSELLTAMYEAGVRLLAIGYESPIREELEAMNKRLRPEKMLELTQHYRQAGFRVHGMFIFGYPMQDGVDFHMSAAERAKHYRDFIRRARIDTVQVLLPIAIPGTGLYERLDKQNRIFSTDRIGWEFYDGNFPTSQPDAPMTAESLQREAQGVMNWFYGWRRVFSIPLNILLFPGLLLSLHNLRGAWSRWSTRWQTGLYRIGGWILLRRWTADFKRSRFLEKLRKARSSIETS